MSEVSREAQNLEPVVAASGALENSRCSVSASVVDDDKLPPMTT
jgi:hypothetical protein